MELFLSTIATILEFFLIAIIVKSLSDSPLLPTRKDLYAVSLITLVSIFILNKNPSVSWILGQFFYFLYIQTYCSDKELLTNRLSLHCLSCGSCILLNLFIYTITSIFLSPDTWYVPILGNIGCILFAVLLFRFTFCKKMYKFLCLAKLPYRFLIINSYLFLIVLLLFFKINPSHFYANLTYWLVIAFILLFTNICMLYYDQQLFQKQQELLSYQKELPVYQSLVDSIRANQHEFSNRLQYIQNLPRVCKDYESLCQALLKSSSDYCNPMEHYALLQMNMPLLAATLYSLSSKADQKGIQVLFHIGSFHIISQAPEYKLTDFISILTQNAIDASKEGDSLYIDITTKDNLIHFEIRNPVSRRYTTKEINEFFKKGYTTKPYANNITNLPHGYGLYTLLEQVTKLGGSVGAECVERGDIFWLIFRLCI